MEEGYQNNRDEQLHVLMFPCGASARDRELFRPPDAAAVDGLEAPFEKLLAEICPDCVIFDFVQWWAGRAAAKFGAASIAFSTFGAAFSSWGMHPVWRQYRNGLTAEDLVEEPRDYPSRSVTLRLYEAAGALFVHSAPEPGAVSFPERSLRGIDACDSVAVKTCAELEGKYIEYFGKVTGKPVVPLGPLLSPHVSGRKPDSDEMTWLDKQSPSSVVYVSFGSQCFLSMEQIAEVALGLEASWQPFLWALHGDSFWVPEGFVERVGKRGAVVRGWFSQREILAHPRGYYDSLWLELFDGRNEQWLAFYSFTHAI
ncbi:hypothetical protein SUGI_0352260 [Cryptomeria japonica]|nr:hypothetical protein SUGI_0352260 [Cryptomeria japonica]